MVISTFTVLPGKIFFIQQSEQKTRDLEQTNKKKKKLC